MGLLKFDIRYPSGQREMTDVEGERAVVGSASHCDVRLPVDAAAYEHLLVEVHAGTVRVTSKSATPAATINGMPLTESVVASDAMLGLGQVRLFVLYVPDMVEGESPTAKGKQESSPLIRLIALVGLPIGGYLVLVDNPVPLEPPPKEAPQLFAEAAKTCPADNPAQAAAMAAEKLELAASKQERLPFALREGAAAVPLYEQAAACLTVAQSSKAAQEANDAAKALRDSIELDFRTRTLRVERMLALEDYELVQRDVKVLSALVEGKKGPFVTWLGGVKRQLKAMDYK